MYFRGADVVARAGLTRQQALALAAEYGDEPEDPGRDDPFDVPVWRRSAGQVPAWPSLWGAGRPGWHAECAAMSMSLLGTSVDVLAGGADLTFPHHAYQAAMVEAASAVTPFARSHLHVGTVHQGGAKMAKSTGNLALVADLLRDHPPATVRMLILDRPWHAPWDYQPDDLAAAARALDDLYTAAGRSSGAQDPGVATDAVIAAFLDNLDVPAAVAVAREAGAPAARLLLGVLSLT